MDRETIIVLAAAVAKNYIYYSNNGLLDDIANTMRLMKTNYVNELPDDIVRVERDGATTVNSKYLQEVFHTAKDILKIEELPNEESLVEARAKLMLFTFFCLNLEKWLTEVIKNGRKK